MGFWSLDEKTQLALIMAGLVGVSTSGCRLRRGDVMDPVPTDMTAAEQGVDMGLDGPPVADPLPPDMGPDGPPVSDMLPPDLGADMHWDPAPYDMSVDHTSSKPDAPPISDPLPPDAAAAFSPSPRWSRPSRPGRNLPLRRDFRSRIQAQRDGDALLCKALIQGGDPARLTYRWITSGGELSSPEGQQVRWVPPTTPGRHMVQVTVRDGHGAISVDMMLHDVE